LHIPGFIKEKKMVLFIFNNCPGDHIINNLYIYTRVAKIVPTLKILKIFLTFSICSMVFCNLHTTCRRYFMKISELNEATGPESGDFLAIVKTAASETKKISADNLGVLSGVEVATFWHEETETTNAGTFTQATDVKRYLSNLVCPGGWCSLYDGTLTLNAGIYLVWASAPAYCVNAHQTFLYDATGEEILVYGSSALASASNNEMSLSMFFHILENASSIDIEVYHRCETTKETDGLGKAAGLGTEIYTQGVIVKIG
jgi:hypothetical protein